MKRKICFWLFFILTIVFAVYFSSRIIMTFMGYGTSAQVRRVAISAPSGHKDVTAITAAAAIAPGTHTYTINLNEVNERISAVPGVRESAVRRRANGNLEIKISLHRTVALWTDGEIFYPLSADGTIVRRATERTPGTVVFRGDVPDSIDEITRAAQNVISDLDYLEWVENRRWNLHTLGGITVMLPEHNPCGAIGTLVAINKNHNILDKDIHVLDMRDDARILIK